MEVTHQVLGDGFFSGDLAMTRVTVGPGARAVVRGISAMPVRRGCSTVATRLDVADGALLWLPGPLVPHRDVRHTSGMDVRMTAASDALIATTLMLGRTGWGEIAAFLELGFRTRLRYAGKVTFAEEAVIEPSSFGGLAGFDRYQAFVSLLAVGPRLGALAFGCHSTDDNLVASSRLRAGGTAVRALFPHLGAALAFLESIERRARGVLDEPPHGAC